MPFRTGKDFIGRKLSFNMTPVIDMVFLLIIFFVLVCRFIEAENFPVAVPDGCEFAKSEPKHQAQATTVTVMKTADGASSFAVGPEKVAEPNYSDLADRLAEMIDARLKDLPPQMRVVTLRIDRGIYFAEAQYALAAIAASTATDIKLAALKERESGAE